MKSVRLGCIAQVGNNITPTEGNLTVGTYVNEFLGGTTTYKGYNFDNDPVPDFGDLQPRDYEGLNLRSVVAYQNAINSTGDSFYLAVLSSSDSSNVTPNIGEVVTNINGIDYTWTYTIDGSFAFYMMDDAEAEALYNALTVDEVYPFTLTATPTPVGIVLGVYDPDVNTTGAGFIDNDEGTIGSMNPTEFFDTGININAVQFTYSAFSGVAVAVISAQPEVLPERPPFNFVIDGLEIEFQYVGTAYLGNVNQEQVEALRAKAGQLLPFSFEEISTDLWDNSEAWSNPEAWPN